MELMLEQILNDCNFVVQNSKEVVINKNRIKEFVKDIETINGIHWLKSSPYGILDLPVDVLVNFLLIYESIDFSFWGQPKWTIDLQDGKEDGSFALLYALLKYIKQNNNTDFSKLELDEFKQILKGNVEIPLLTQRYRIIKEISNTVDEKMNGNFYIIGKCIFSYKM